MWSRWPTVVLAGVALATFPLPVQAGGTRTFELRSFDELDDGETEGAAIESSGRVTVGYLPERGDVKAAAAFSCLGEANSVLVGTSDAAQIFRVRPKAQQPKRKSSKPPAKKGNKEANPPDGTLALEKLASLPGVVVSAMVRLKNGDVLAATLPGGTIHRVDSRGKVTEFAKIGVEQIWALRVHKDRLLAATGPKGELHSLSLTGKDDKVILDVEEKHLLSMATVGDRILVGTGPQARLYEVGNTKEGTLLHDFSGDEIRSIAVTKTGLAVAVNEFSDRGISSVDALTKTLNRTSLVGQPPTGEFEEIQPPKAEAHVYWASLGPQLDVDRASEVAWELRLSRERQYFTDLLAIADDAVLVASSDGGKIYRVRGLRDIATVVDLEERQATALCRAGKNTVFATTAHGAGVYQLHAAKAATARYLTKALDAEQPAAYGAVTLRGSGQLKLRARVGPSEEPDRRWSEWRSIETRRENGGLHGSLAGLPHRRYLQVEVALGDRDSDLRGMELFYAPENLAPLIKSIDVDRPELGDGEREPSPSVTIKWSVDSRDDDELIYDVRVRPEGGGEPWVKLNSGDKLVTKHEYSWDLSTVPDGVYEVEIVASDEPSNGTAKARKDGLISDPVIVDRQRPTIASVTIKGRRLTGTAQDRGSYIHDVAFSLDNDAFRSASPQDGLFDGTSEAFVLDLPDDLTPGQHRLVIRARDAFGNIGTFPMVIKG